MPESGARNISQEEEIRNAFEKAERFIKIVEAIDDEVIIPAINELRYAGFHLTRFLTAPCDEKRSQEYNSVLSHCRRASYEALDAGLIFLLEKVQTFKEDYKRVVISEVVADYPDILVYADEVNDLLVQPRQDGDNRDEDFGAREKAFNELRCIVNKLDKAREELNKKIWKERRNTILALVSVAVTLLGVIVTILLK